MILAVLELGDLDRHLLGLGLGLLADLLQLLPDLGVVLDLVQQQSRPVSVFL